jgi:hypothetical protein
MTKEILVRNQKPSGGYQEACERKVGNNLEWLSTQQKVALISTGMITF